jgi:hypothetical protein
MVATGQDSHCTRFVWAGCGMAVQEHKGGKEQVSPILYAKNP